MQVTPSLCQKAGLIGQFMKLIFIFFALLLVPGCTWYGEFEHISSIPNGTPFNSRAETSTDVIWTGVKVQKDSWYVDTAVGYETSSEFEGRNPYGRIKLGKEFKTWD